MTPGQGARGRVLASLGLGGGQLSVVGGVSQFQRIILLLSWTSG